jgi:hypothetical protein
MHIRMYFQGTNALSQRVADCASREPHGTPAIERLRSAYGAPRKTNPFSRVRFLFMTPILDTRSIQHLQNHS